MKVYIMMRKTWEDAEIVGVYANAFDVEHDLTEFGDEYFFEEHEVIG